MRGCISTLACPAWSLEQIVDAVASAGLGGIDFRGVGADIDITQLHAFDGGLRKTLDLLGSRGLAMPCLNTSVTLVTPATERWHDMLTEMQRYVTLAGASGTRLLRIFGGAPPGGMTRDEAKMLATRHLRQLLKIVGGAARLVLETHDAWSTSDEVLSLLEGFDVADLGILWDVEHPFRRGESPSRTVQRLRPWLSHVHVKDSVRGGGSNSPRLLGEGELPLDDCVAALREHAYDGWLCLETEKRWRPEAPEPEQSIPQFAQWLRSHA